MKSILAFGDSLTWDFEAWTFSSFLKVRQLARVVAACAFAAMAPPVASADESIEALAAKISMHDIVMEQCGEHLVLDGKKVNEVENLWRSALMKGGFKSHSFYVRAHAKNNNFAMKLVAEAKKSNGEKALDMTCIGLFERENEMLGEASPLLNLRKLDGSLLR